MYLYDSTNCKIKEILFFAHISYFKETFNLVIFCSIRPLVASGEKPKAFFFLTEFMPFKFEYNLNFDYIFVKHSNVVFQPI